MQTNIEPKETTTLASEGNSAKKLLAVLQGGLIGLGAVLPGISGGVLSVVFGIYKPIMELLSSPFRRFKTHVPKLLPYVIGAAIGFLGVSKLLGFVLEKYPDPSVCLFIGLIVGLMPSIWREAGEQGRTKGSYLSMVLAFLVVLALLIGLKLLEIAIVPNFGWYLFCGFCLALSMIAPGMSFSTLLMPLGLYAPFVDGIGSFDFSVLIPGGIGALVTVIALAKAVDALFKHYYSVAFHAIVGIVAAATVMIIPFASFTSSVLACVINVVMLAAGIVYYLIVKLLSVFLRKFERRLKESD